MFCWDMIRNNCLKKQVFLYMICNKFLKKFPWDMICNNCFKHKFYSDMISNNC
jgi:hypothetical protein